MGLSQTAEVLISSLPLVAVVVLGILFFFNLLWDYKKSRLIIERGGTPPPKNIEEKILLIGIVSLFVGLGLMVFFIIYAGLSDSLLGGIIPTMVGMGIIVHYLFIHLPKRGKE